MAKVSIIIPVHNPGAYLRQTLSSIQDQTFTDWELLIIDDNSSEDLSWIATEFPAVRYIRQPHGGVSVARNHGVLLSSGEYIAFVDQDDLWRPDKLGAQVQILDDYPAAALCFCDLDIVGPDHAYSKAETWDARPEPIVELPSRKEAALSRLHQSLRFFSARLIVPSTVLLRRRCLATSGLLDPFIPFSGDYDLLIKLGSRHDVVHLPRKDVYYRKHGNNFSDQYQVGRAEVAALIARYTNYARSRNDTQLARAVAGLFKRPGRVYAAQAFDGARRALHKRDIRKLLEHLAFAFYFDFLFTVRSICQWASTRLSRRDPV